MAPSVGVGPGGGPSHYKLGLLIKLILDLNNNDKKNINKNHNMEERKIFITKDLLKLIWKMDSCFMKIS